MPKTTRSETKWKSPAVEYQPSRFEGRRGRTREEIPEIKAQEPGAYYVLRHASEEPERIRLCVGGSNVLLDRAMLDALIADLTDARGSLPGPTLDPHGGALDGGYDK